jgi:aryl-alcohol dehydrogenase-like predicted oxidoreductase
MAAAGMNFIARSPLSRGLMAHGADRAGAPAFPADDFRSTLPQDWLEWILASRERLRPMLAGTGDLAEMALRYSCPTAKCRQ